MTGGRFEPYRVAKTYDQGQSNEPAETWVDAEPWQDAEPRQGAEAWDYDEARANPDAYDRLEFRLMSERAEGPEFSRFRAAMADFPEGGADIGGGAGMELRPEPALDDEVSWLQAIRTGRFWSNALWLTGAACAGVVAGLVSTNFVALALNAEASSVLAGQFGTAFGSSPPALSARAPSSMTASATATAAKVRTDRPDAVLSTPAGGLTPSRPAAAPEELARLQTGPLVALNSEPAGAPMTPLQVAALAEPDSFRLEMAPTETAPTGPASDPAPAAPPAASGVVRDAQLTATPPSPATLQLAALVEPAPGLPEPARAEPTRSAASPIQSVTPPTPPAVAAAVRVVAAPPAVTAAATPAAQYRVQLALLRDEDNAKYVWHDFVARFGSSAKDLQRYVFPTQTAHGVRHLVQVGPFGDQDHAEAMCNQLKERGGDCLVVRQPS